ncbi:uncharacterized protein [Prorops nasuta]|uniref:uncharacterized protein n=1 Tax=Prorops nasuta TaxID=863751 RepID=UPI0034CE2354
MSQPTLNSSFSGINFLGMNRGGTKLSYSSLRAAASGDNSINEEERLSTPNVHTLMCSSAGSAASAISEGGAPAFPERSSSRLSQPDVGRILRHEIPAKRERLSQPTLVTGDYYPVRGQQRLSQPCLTASKELPTILHSPLKHKRFCPPPATAITQRDRLYQLDFGASRYRNLKDINSSTSKFNRDRFSIPELETQNDLRLMAGTPKQRFSLDSQLRRESNKSVLLPIASSPISEHQTKIEEAGTSTITTATTNGTTTTTVNVPKKGRNPAVGLGSVIVASTSPIFPPDERQILSPFAQVFAQTATTTLAPQSKPAGTAAFPAPTSSAASSLSGVLGKVGLVVGNKPSAIVPPLPIRERMSVPEIRISSLRRLLDPPTRQRHSITGNLKQSLLSPGRAHEIVRKPRYSVDEALERLRREEENEINEEENRRRARNILIEEPKHIQRHYSYTYDTKDEGTILGKMSSVPRKKYLESNFDENEQVITTVIETDVPIFLAPSPKHAKKTQVLHTSETSKWLKKCLANDGRKLARQNLFEGEKELSKVKRKNSRKISLESLEMQKQMSEKKIRSRSMGSSERSPLSKISATNVDLKETYVRIVDSDSNQQNKYQVSIESNWAKNDLKSMYDATQEDMVDSDDSTSI